MATALAMKRMARERKILESPNEDYIVHFQDDNLRKFDAYVIGPSGTLYSHKFVKLHFEIPDEYPLVPPKCKFIQYSGGRIHPNLYVDGKVCLSILGTWSGEKWATAMTCETVLITIRSLLDNKPYTHEPNQRDLPSYNDYVQYGTWRWLLLDYIRHEQEPKFKAFLQTYIATHADELLDQLKGQAVEKSDARQYLTPYGSRIVPNYPSLQKDLEACVEGCRIEEARKAEQQVALAVTVAPQDLSLDGNAASTAGLGPSVGTTPQPPVLSFTHDTEAFRH